MGVFNLVLSIRKYSKSLLKLIQISSDEVFGPILEGEADETFPLNPTSPYAASKACGDLLLLSYYKTYNLPLVIIRPCNNYGSAQYPEKLIPMTITRLLDGKKALLHGEGKEIREWIYVEDCCMNILNILEYGKCGEIYNIGSKIRLSNIEVITKIVEGVKKDSRVWDWVEKVENRPGNDQRYAVSTGKFDRLISYNPKYMNFDTGLSETIKWYADNIHRYQDVNIDSNIYKSNVEYFR
jgi:dTDP-glucose 4,6-dehydratase